MVPGSRKTIKAIRSPLYDPVSKHRHTGRFQKAQTNTTVLINSLFSSSHNFLSFFFFKILVGVGSPVCVNVDTFRGQKRAFDTLELETVVSPLAWLLGRVMKGAGMGDGRVISPLPFSSFLKNILRGWGLVSKTLAVQG